MNDFMVEMVLSHFRFDDAQKARIRAAIPKALYVFQLAKHNKTVASELIDVGEMILNQISEQERQ